MRTDLMIESAGIDLNIFAENDEYLLYLFKLQLALAKNYKMQVEVAFNFTAEENELLCYWSCIMTNIDEVKSIKWIAVYDTLDYMKTYLEALELGLVEAIKILKELGKL